jgi:SSS family solute:Na+ symporter
VTIAAGGIVFESLMGIDFWTGALVVVVATGLYTILGGLRAVLYTDMIQMFVLLGGSVTVTVIGLTKSDPDFPWTGILFGAPILGVWYWCTDQFIVQRVLSAADENQARRGTIFGGFLKVLPLFLFVIPGVIAYALSQRGVLALDRPDQALPTMIGVLLPAGLKGLVVAGLLAALMSSLSSVFNSCSTLITWDIYRKLHPTASERQLVRVGQLATTVLVGFGLAWIPMMQFISGQLYVYLQSVQGYISPPIAAVFLLGIASKRMNAKGAIAALFSGFLLGMGRLVAELSKDSLSGLLYTYADINFLHFAIFLFVVCSMVLVVVSLLTAHAPDEQLAGLTFATAQEAVISGLDAAWRRKDLLLSVLLALCVGAVWLYFTG